jgi:hypothetical protein
MPGLLIEIGVLPELALNQDPPYFHLLSSWDDRREPPNSNCNQELNKEKTFVVVNLHAGHFAC